MPFNAQQGFVGYPIVVRWGSSIFWGYREIFEFLSKNDDGLFREQWVLSCRRAEFGRRWDVQ